MSRQACKGVTAAAMRNLLRVDAARVNKAVAARKDAVASMRTAQGPARLLPVPEHRSSCGVAHLPEQRKSGVGGPVGGYDTTTAPSSFTDASGFFNSEPWVLSQSSDPATCYCLLLHSCDVCLLLHSFLFFATWYCLLLHS